MYAKRSVIPRVVGILGMVFAPIGFGLALLFTLGPMSSVHRWGIEQRIAGTVSWLYISLAISLVLFAVHLAGAIASCLYRPIGPRLLVGYATGALALIGIDLVMMWGFMPRITDHDIKSEIAIARSIFDGLALLWPILVLSLMTSRSARAACAPGGAVSSGGYAGPQQYM